MNDTQNRFIYGPTVSGSSSIRFDQSSDTIIQDNIHLGVMRPLGEGWLKGSNKLWELRKSEVVEVMVERKKRISGRVKEFNWSQEEGTALATAGGRIAWWRLVNRESEPESSPTKEPFVTSLPFTACKCRMVFDGRCYEYEVIRSRRATDGKHIPIVKSSEGESRGLGESYTVEGAWDMCSYHFARIVNMSGKDEQK